MAHDDPTDTDDRRETSELVAAMLVHRAARPAPATPADRRRQQLGDLAALAAAKRELAVRRAIARDRATTDALNPHGSN